MYELISDTFGFLVFDIPMNTKRIKDDNSIICQNISYRIEIEQTYWGILPKITFLVI